MLWVVCGPENPGQDICPTCYYLSDCHVGAEVRPTFPIRFHAQDLVLGYLIVVSASLGAVLICVRVS
jgi:hypothetical protein